jgi:predicted ribosome quality control (RQC) complex YloA/Tae2 family protein
VKILEETIAQTVENEIKLANDAKRTESAESTGDMEELVKRYILSTSKEKADRQMRPAITAKLLRKQERTAHTFRRFTTNEGYEIFVGRNDTQNDALIRQSNGNDLWFHIRDFPGSHVVLKTGGKKDVPFTAILEAAKTALNFSSRVRDGKGTVTYTQVKNLKKPKNSAPGKVLVTREKTVDVRLD